MLYKRKGGQNKMVDYVKLRETYESYGCKLLSTEEEVNKLMEVKKKSIEYQKLRFESKCGHESEGYLVNLKYKGTGMNCRKCAYKCISVKAKGKDDKEIGMKIEYEGFVRLRNLIKNDFELEKTCEGCHSDLIIRPYGSQDDEWLMIQLKTTQEPTFGLYSFSLHGNKYDSCIVVSICLENDHMWVIDGPIISHLKSKLNIAVGVSKYDKYKANKDDLSKILSKFYVHKEKFPENLCMCPLSSEQQQEQKYRKIREEKLHFLPFIYPEMEALKYDFQINGINIQEKVATKRKNRPSFVVDFNKNYKTGMNKFYWIHVPDTQIFYILPEEELANHDFIDHDKLEKQKTILSLSITHDNVWYNTFKHTYTDLNIDYIKSLFH